MNWNKGIVRFLWVAMVIFLLIEWYWSTGIGIGPMIRHQREYGEGPFIWIAALIWPGYFAGKWIVRGLKKKDGEDTSDE